LVEVGDDVVGVLGAHATADQVGRDSCELAARLRCCWWVEIAGIVATDLMRQVVARQCAASPSKKVRAFSAPPLTQNESGAVRLTRLPP